MPRASSESYLSEEGTTHSSRIGVAWTRSLAPLNVCGHVCTYIPRIVCKYVEGSLPRTKNGRYFADDGFIRGSLTRLLVSTFVFTFFARTSLHRHLFLFALYSLPIWPVGSRRSDKCQQKERRDDGTSIIKEQVIISLFE